MIQKQPSRGAFQAEVCPSQIVISIKLPKNSFLKSLTYFTNCYIPAKYMFSTHFVSKLLGDNLRDVFLICAL